MDRSLIDDASAGGSCRRQASDVELRSAQAPSQTEDMNTFILFCKNRPDFKAIVQYNDFDVLLQGGLPLQSRDAFEAEAAGLAQAMSAG